jgi:hypothetical protein
MDFFQFNQPGFDVMPKGPIRRISEIEAPAKVLILFLADVQNQI